mmetsp:Transcript_21562/g.31899  ORF Transcript_21562/g.31899 Transcript_21562/m.31899 type:complete len:226 (-) Transcript_21562:203-880(-)
MCAKVDKVTLKLFIAVLESGKLHRALDLVNRLHLEKSYDIAVTVSDRLNFRNLSDRIELAKDRRFALSQTDDDEDDDDDEGGSLYTENVAYSDEDRETTSRRGYTETKRISPDLHSQSPKNKRPRSLSQKDEMNEDPILTRRVRPKKEPMEEDIKEESPKPTPSRGVVKRNPFLKRRLESPAKFSQSKESHSQPQPSPSAGASLSRMSTFSAQSRERRKNAKNII